MKDDFLIDHTSGRLSRREAPSDFLSTEANDLRNPSFAPSVIYSSGDAAILRRNSSVDRAALRPDGGFRWLGQGKEVEEASHRRLVR